MRKISRDFPIRNRDMVGDRGGTYMSKHSSMILLLICICDKDRDSVGGRRGTVRSDCSEFEALGCEPFGDAHAVFLSTFSD